MVVAAYIAMAVFLVLLLSMALTAGTQVSISALAAKWRWLLLAALWSQVMLLPQMMEITPEGWKWMPFLGIFFIMVCGGASVFDEADRLVHIIVAVLGFVCLFGWVILMQPRFLMPFFVCVFAGRERLVWRAEVGLIASVYTTLILN